MGFDTVQVHTFAIPGVATYALCVSPPDRRNFSASQILQMRSSRPSHTGIRRDKPLVYRNYHATALIHPLQPVKKSQRTTLIHCVFAALNVCIALGSGIQRRIVCGINRVFFMACSGQRRQESKITSPTTHGQSLTRLPCY